MNATGLFLDFLSRIGLGRIDDDISPVLLGGLELVIVEINGYDVGLKDVLSPLNTEISQTTGTINSNP